MSDARVREPFPYVRACVVLVAGLALAAALALRDGLRRVGQALRKVGGR